jgi:hypothetical protein
MDQRIAVQVKKSIDHHFDSFVARASVFSTIIAASFQKYLSS